VASPQDPINKGPYERTSDGCLFCDENENGGGGGATNVCACENSKTCDKTITTSEGVICNNTACQKKSNWGYRGLKCFYWNPKLKINEERWIQC